ncbi:ribonuclease P/MRP protein subunit POP1 [Fusarium austroafricanum]|uniref:Ribonuclease P/MRP protein subunit POP1 n=1 Tax=Fusarium austroafricanum TaxID=2364996 RepID=A0A8H4KDI0_9HYPO|nr:ribonuclease P/MRP protein subunit POP1 [Fusarium austroafricanum]
MSNVDPSIGDIMMLSEGKTTAGTLFTLHEGILTMFVDKEMYERAGLIGKPYGSKGGRGSKPRWVIAYNLREPPMLRGHKGYDRLIYACKTVFTQPMTWLFCNSTTQTPSPDPLQRLFPTAFTSSPSLSQNLAVLQPSLDVDPEVLAENDREALEYFATGSYEWLSLIRLGSSRVDPQDVIDPYLSRYSVPGDVAKISKVCKLSWEGFISAQWLRGLLMEILTTGPSGTWFSLSATCFSKSVSGTSNDLTILRPPNAAGKYLMWETKSSD